MTDYVSGDELSDDDALIHLALFAECDPLQNAVKESKWKKAMEEEIKAIEKNQTWELTDPPKENKIIGMKWVYKTKLNEKGGVDKYKARLVAKGYKQQFGVDYKEVRVRSSCKARYYPASYYHGSSKFMVYFPVRCKISFFARRAAGGGIC